MNDPKKQNAAKAAIDCIGQADIIGVGTGSTVNFFIEELAKIKHRLKACVPSSQATEERLKAHQIPIDDLNNVGHLPLYVDGADEFDVFGRMIKGGGGALTREKICAACSQQFICIADDSKRVEHLGKFPLPIEVIPIARSYVARELLKLHAHPVYRQGFVTDNGHVILDVFHLSMEDPLALEETLNNITGIVAHGIFARRACDKILMGTTQGVDFIDPYYC